MIEQVDKISLGKQIVGIAKSLKAYRVDDPRLAAFLYSSSLAGRAGLLAAACRNQRGLSKAAFAMMGAEEGLNPLDLRDRVEPWLENAGLCRLNRDANGVLVSLDSLVLRYDSILIAVTDLHESLGPTPEDLAVIEVASLVSDSPRMESEALQVLAVSFGEERARTAVTLATAYSVVARREGKGLIEPILFSHHLWSHNIAKIAKALGTLDANDRQFIAEFLNRVKAYQGMPEPMLRTFAGQNGVEHLVDLAIGVGLLNRTDIQMADRGTRAFLTTPHFYQDLAADHGSDTLDRVKIFLDSIRNGQHFGSYSTGKISDPEKLLRKLLNSGEIGPCTAIGSDYVTSEKAGIVKVHRVKGTQFTMELVQDDTVRKVYEVVTAGSIDNSFQMEASNIREGTKFHSIEERRAAIGELPGEVAEAERAIIVKLREGK